MVYYSVVSVVLFAVVLDLVIDLLLLEFRVGCCLILVYGFDFWFYYPLFGLYLVAVVLSLVWIVAIMVFGFLLKGVLFKFGNCSILLHLVF